MLVDAWNRPESPPVASVPASSQPRVETGDPLLRMIGTLPLRTDQSFQEPATAPS